MMMNNIQPLKKQQGAVLFVSLIILLLMTLIGISGMQTTVLEEKMSGNFKDRVMSFEAGESALRAAEEVLRVTLVLPTFTGGTVGYYEPTTSGAARWDESVTDWQFAVAGTGDDPIVYGGTLSSIATAPAYIIEEMPAINESGGSLEAGVVLENRYYRITTRATGGTDTAVVMLQSTYKR